MKFLSLFLSAFTLSFSSFAQHPIQMSNLWMKPQVHVLFNGYTVSFTIKDINKALALLAETGDTIYGTTSGLDTAGNYFVELYPGLHQEYINKLQPLLQKGVGTFLLTARHAYIENSRHKKVSVILSDIQPLIEGEDITTVKFYDPENNKLIFEGVLDAAMYNKDLGID